MSLANDTALVLIDMQGKLAEIVYESEHLLSQTEKLIQGMKILQVPIIYLEQYPEGLGPTSPLLKRHLTNEKAISKVTFSACDEKSFMDELNALNKKRLLVAGMETHICVYQTVKDLLTKGYHIELVADAISSRTHENKQIGLDKMCGLGASLTSLEMALFELMQTAKHPKFKEISKLIK